MSKKSSSDAAAFNGDKHGELYSPEYAVHIETEDKGKQQKAEQDKGQGDLYSPASAIHISASQQKKQDSNKKQSRVKVADAKSRMGNDEDDKQHSSESMMKPSSKL